MAEIAITPADSSDLRAVRTLLREHAEGVGVSHVRAEAAARPPERLRLDTRPTTAAAQALYERLGSRDTL